MWDSTTGKEIRQFFAGHADRTYTVAFSPNGKWIACGGQERIVILYDLATGKEIRRLTGLPGAASSLAFSLDSRTLAWGSWYAEPIELLEMATNHSRHQFSGHRGRIHALVFSPDGMFLASGSSDTTALIWDLTGSTRLHGNKASPSAEALGAWWTGLASDDAPTAYDSLCKLVSAPNETVPFLSLHLIAVPSVSLKTVPKLIADLENDQFVVREKASLELEQLDGLIEQTLRQTLEQHPSPEVARRVKDLLDKIEKQHSKSDQLRLLRAVETLEYIATPGALEILKKLASGASEARLTLEAKESLGRLMKRPTIRP